LKSHEDLHGAILKLKSNPDISRTEFYQLAFVQEDGEPPPDPTELFNAAILVVKVLTMVDCSVPYHSSDRLEKGAFRIHWKDYVAFSEYLQDLFPIENHPILSYADSELFVDMKSELRATKLKKRLGITFRATHDVRNHLRFDRKQNVLEIFHHTAFLKEQLRLTKGDGGFSGPSGCIKV
jgi:hypothetical protein